MAKLKKTAGKTTSKGSPRKQTAGKPRFAPGAKSITESAQQIWLAGMGAFNRAQAEGSKLFETLVRDGLSLEQTARKIAGHRATAVRDVVEDRVGQARERAADTWDKLEKVFEDRVQRALVKLGVPGRDDINALTERVERLTEAVRKANVGAPSRKPAKAPGTTRAAKATPKAPAKQARKATKATKAAKTARKPAGSRRATPNTAPQTESPASST
ncbi:phasin family protein [Thermomonas sp.]|uniref:phasin family protein n=1 Tax=Thermomonas sp. TaxID=1971895 RepID=UPI00391D7CB3